MLGLEAEGGLIELDAQVARRELDLGVGGHARSEVPVRALAVGDAGLRVRLKTPDGQEIVKPLRLPVRDYRPPQRQTRVETLKPGGRGSVLTQDLLKDLQPDSGTLLLSASGAGRLDLPGLLQSLDRYPFGCAEQITSRALPLLYLNQIAMAAGLSGEREAGPRIKEAIADLIGKQGLDGGFGLGGPAVTISGWTPMSPTSSPAPVNPATPCPRSPSNWPWISCATAWPYAGDLGGALAGHPPTGRVVTLGARRVARIWLMPSTSWPVTPALSSVICAITPRPSSMPSPRPWRGPNWAPPWRFMVTSPAPTAPLPRPWPCSTRARRIWAGGSTLGPACVTPPPSWPWPPRAAPGPSI